jgi:hypothetical protein
MKVKKCPVLVNRHPCSLQTFRIGTFDEKLKPSFDVYDCAKGHRTYFGSENEEPKSKTDGEGQGLARSMDISLNFGIKKFKTKKEATDFLRRFTFKLILRWSEYDVWEIKEQPKIRAMMFENKNGRYIVAQIEQRNAD